MIEVPFHPAYYVDTEGCGSYEGLSDEQPTHGRASELDQAIIKAELDNMFRADLYQKIELNLIGLGNRKSILSKLYQKQERKEIKITYKHSS